MPARIAHGEFVAFVRTQVGQELTTLKQHKPFTVRYTANGLLFTPGSTAKPRQQSFDELDHLLEKFAASGSLRPVDYQTSTRNASYLLTLIALYLKRL